MDKKKPKMEKIQCVYERRVIRSKYLAIKNSIYDDKNDITKVDSDKFNTIINEVESLHKLVKRPREQVADAEALLDIANTIAASVRSHTNGVTPSDFVSALLGNFIRIDGMANVKDLSPYVIAFDWAEVGQAVSPAFKKASGCSTFIGPMSAEMKQYNPRLRGPSACKRRPRPTDKARPEELTVTDVKGISDTDKIIVAMFETLRKKRSAKLEALVLNRGSFAQTVENIFALSFLVKDGRVEITMNNAGHHLVSPRNAPAATAVTSGQVSFHHFVFRFDFKDWKLMANSVGVGEELMPHRHCTDTGAAGCSKEPRDLKMNGCSQVPTTPIRKFSSHRSLVGKSSPEEGTCGYGESRSPPRPRKRSLFS